MEEGRDEGEEGRPGGLRMSHIRGSWGWKRRDGREVERKGKVV